MENLRYNGTAENVANTFIKSPTIYKKMKINLWREVVYGEKPELPGVDGVEVHPDPPVELLYLAGHSILHTNKKLRLNR